jgi:hypothetical protein
MKIKRKYVQYYEWEDWLNGMWNKADKDKEVKLLSIAIKFTGDHVLYSQAMGEVILSWPRTMVNSLTNVSINRCAFLGHCAVCYKLQIPEYITRIAWKELTNEQRFLADKEAEKHIKRYERENTKIHSGMGAQLLLEWPA